VKQVFYIAQTDKELKNCKTHTTAMQDSEGIYGKQSTE